MPWCARAATDSTCWVLVGLAHVLAVGGDARAVDLQPTDRLFLQPEPAPWPASAFVVSAGADLAIAEAFAGTPATVPFPGSRLALGVGYQLRFASIAVVEPALWAGLGYTLPETGSRFQREVFSFDCRLGAKLGVVLLARLFMYGELLGGLLLTEFGPADPLFDAAVGMDVRVAGHIRMGVAAGVRITGRATWLSLGPRMAYVF